MHRFYLEPQHIQGTTLVLPESESHHAATVLRLRAGEMVTVLDGAGCDYHCETVTVDRKRVELKVIQKQVIAPLPCRITLIQAIPKGKTMDLIVQKATELGAHRIIPILSERTVAQVEEEAAEAKVEKWKATAIEAIKQCGSPWLPKIETPLTPKALLARNDQHDLSLVASLQPGALHPRECLRNFQIESRRPAKSVAVWVGPEGDFTPAEIQAIRAAGAWPITLGRLVLRSETAAIYCLSVLSYELQA